VPPSHEQAWADALAQEHLHQRELLATLRDELGTFARECASALTALDTFVGLAGVAEVLSAAQATTAHAKLALEVGRRLHGGEDPELVDLYSKVASHEDVPPPLVRHASDLLASGPKRTDRQLLQAVVSASGASSQVEQLVGSAPWVAIAALKPLVKWLRADGRKELLHSAGGDLAQVLTATAALGAGGDTQTAGDAAALGQSLRDAADHVELAAKSVREGKLAAVLKEARERLQGDLDALRGIHEGAHDAPSEWREARKAEHAELSEEVRVKLEKIERIRGALFRLLPHLQAITRALGVVQRLHALEGRLEPAPAAGVSAAESALVLELSALFEDMLPETEPARLKRRVSRRTTVTTIAAAMLIGGGIGAAFALSGSSKPKPVVTEAAPPTTSAPPPPTTTAVAIPPKPVLSPVKAFFDFGKRATFYSITLRPGGETATEINWTLTTPPGNPTCHKFGPVPGHPDQAVWHHASTDGCTHNGIQHDGTVHVTVLSAHWKCTESFFGTLTRTGAKNETCVRR